MKNDNKVHGDISSGVISTSDESKSHQSKDPIDPVLKSLQVLTSLNLRSKPEMSAEILLVMKKGSIVHEVSFNDEWAFVRTENGHEGWAMKEFLKEI